MAVPPAVLVISGELKGSERRAAIKESLLQLHISVTRDETIRHRIRWVSYALVCISALLILKGSIQFLTPPRGQDFWYRWSGQQYVSAGIDPFWIAFWTNDHKGRLPPELPLEVAVRAGDPVNIVDPPWVFAYGALIYWPQKQFARFWFLLLNYAALLLLIWLVHRLNDDLDPRSRLFCTAAFFANVGFSQQLINGNYGIFAVTAAVACFLALRFRSSMLAGAAFALAQIKMTIGTPLSILLIVKRKGLAMLTAAVILLVCSLWTSHKLGISVPALFERMLEGANRFSNGGHSLYQILPVLGVPKKMALMLCAAFVLGLSMWVARHRENDDSAQMAIFAVCARIFTYHNVIDDVVIALLVLSAARTWIQSGCDKRGGVVVGILVCSVLMPGVISNKLGAQILLQLVWCLCLTFVLISRLRNCEACTAD